MYSFEPFNIRFKHKVIFKSDEIVLPETGLVVLTGGIGTGKTTLLKRIYLGQICPREFSRKRFKLRCSFKMFDPICHPKDTGEMHLRRVEKNRWIDRELFAHLASQLGVLNKINEVLESFSAGEKARYFLALTAAESRPVLLLDEPTSNLDEVTAEVLRLLLVEMAKERLVVVATHDRHLIEKTADRLDISDGQLTQSGRVAASAAVSALRTKRRRTIFRPPAIAKLLLTSLLAILSGCTGALFHHLTSEYISPTLINYAFTEVPDRQLTRLDTSTISTRDQDRLNQLLRQRDDYFFSPKSFEAKVLNRTIDLSDLQKVVPFLQSITYIPSDQVAASVDISTRLYQLLQRVAGNFPLSYLTIGNLPCKDLIASDGLSVFVPKNLLVNFQPKFSLGVEAAGLIFDENGQKISLAAGTAAVPHDRFLTLKNTVISDFSGNSYTVKAYYFDYQQEYILPRTSDLRLDIANDRSSLNSSWLYFQEEITNPYFTLAAAVEIDRENYLNYLDQKGAPRDLILVLSLEAAFVLFQSCLAILFFDRKKIDHRLDLFYHQAPLGKSLIELPWIGLTLFGAVYAISYRYLAGLTCGYNFFAAATSSAFIFGSGLFILLFLASFLVSLIKSVGLRKRL